MQLIHRLDTKSKVHEPIEDIIANAENEMYRDKLMHRKEVNRYIDTIIDTPIRESRRTAFEVVTAGAVKWALFRHG